MPKDTRHAAAVFGALLAAGLLSGVAVAGNPHGTPPGQAKQQQSSASAAGVKPSSTTQHNTHAAAGSNQTKLYGNGKTAGQIAQQNGATSTTDLYGPGNSQPHKAQVCSKNGKSHDVDVHALKSHGGASCSTASGSSSGASHGKSGLHTGSPHGASGSQGVSATHGNSANAHEHVTICHATPPDTAAGGYVLISPSASGVFHGHLQQHAADIIPPFVYNGITYSLNWDATGQAIFANGCVAPSSTSGTAAGASTTQQAETETVAQANATANAILGALKGKSSSAGVKGAQETKSGGVLGARKTLGRVAGRARAPRAVTGAASFAG